MKVIPAALQTVLAAGGMTLTRCWRITSRLGEVIGFTKHTRDIEVDGFLYTAFGGLRDTAVEQSEGLQVDNQELTLFVSSLDRDLINSGWYDKAQVEVFDLDYQQPDVGTIPYKVGILGNVRLGDGLAQVEVRGPAQFLQTKIGEIFTSTCPVRLGSARCKVKLLDESIINNLIFTAVGSLIQIEGILLAQQGYKVGDTVQITGTSTNDGQYTIAVITGDTMGVDQSVDNEEIVASVKRFTGFSFLLTVTSVDTAAPRRIFTCAVPTLPTGITIEVNDFQEGEAVFVTGDNQGIETKSIRSHLGYQFTLYDEFPYAIAIGDTVLVTKGCDKLYTTCRDTFANLINFQGFPYVPVPEQVFDSPVQI